ncbi:MAG: hypothetical protein JW958_00065 [Candidatus Eisenbacteria bacterium]|nr:hypothetical protein [Candidatus Eisenbacteria bacterium]
MSASLPRRAGWLILVLFLASFAVDLLLDARGRDCFSWMDPTQYHAFARAAAAGGPRDFSVASLFPYLLVPFLAARDSIPAALSANLLFALLLAGAAAALARALRLRLPAAVPVILTLTAPLLVGLSRELYVEYALSAAVAWQLALWVRGGEPDRGAAGIVFGLLFGAGLLLKMTYPVFFVGPWMYETIRRIRGRDARGAIRLSLTLGVPAAAALIGVRLLAPEMWSYYASLGNTRIPIMRLIGPPEVPSLASLAYYPWQILRSALGLPALLLFLPLIHARRLGGEDEEGRRAARLTALAFLVPILLFTLQAVKEPRHIAPIVVPGIMLLLLAFERVRPPALRGALVAATLLLSIAQYMAITRGETHCPYYMRGGLALREIERVLVEGDPERAVFQDRMGRVDINRWRFTKSVAVAGFGPNEALALAWRFAPGVLYDLDGTEWGARDERAYDRFEDLFSFPAFNAYNRRCNWPHAYHTLDREAVLETADFLLLRGTPPAEGKRLYPGHRLVGLVEEGTGGPVLVLAPRLVPFESYRELYAREILRRRPGMERRDLSAIYFDLFLEKRLEGRPMDRSLLLRGFPEGFEPGMEMRNIYWIAPYGPLRAIGLRDYRAHLEGRL